jgi:hypothetical protein
MTMSENGYANRDAILGLTKRRFCDFEIDGVKFRLRSLMESERSNYELSILSKKGVPDKIRMANAKARFLVLVLVDADGNTIFGEEDIPKLMGLDSRYTQTLWDEARKHCGMEDEDMESLVKNSGSVPAEGSPSN